MSEKPNHAERAKVRTMAAVGINHELIAKRMGCSLEALQRLYGADLRRAGPETRAMVGASLFAAAKAGNIAAIIFWLKTRAGWTETIRREISGAAGMPFTIETGIVRVFLPCNGRGTCPKISDPGERRVYYERVLGRELPSPRNNRRT